jgi:hypothetical protein
MLSTDGMNPFGERSSTQHMASDTDDVQPACIVVLEEEVSFAIRPYTGPQASWHRYRCFS